MRSPARTTALFSTLALLHPSASTPVQLPTLPHSLARRDNTAVSCGTWATANAGDAGRGLGSNGDDTVFVAAGACGRVGCYDTSGVYVCNDQSDDLAFGMDEVVAQVAWLKEVCGEHGAVSGQVFSEEHGGYNVNVGFCDSGDPVTKGPGEYVRWGPEGKPGNICGAGTGTPCHHATCIEDTLVITNQTIESCNAGYFAAQYSSPGETASYSVAFTTTTTWETGVDLGISIPFLESVAASFSWSAAFSESHSTATEIGTSAMCGETDAGDFTCGMHIVPGCYRMIGTCETEGIGTVPWANQVPRLNMPGGQAVYTTDLCTCPNCPDADGEGAPNLCPQDCLQCR